MPGNRLNVNTSQMITAAENLRAKSNEVKQRFDAIASIMNNTKNYWSGDAADSHRKMYNDQKDDVNSIINRIREHPVDLGYISQEYLRAERESIAKAEGLGKPIS